MRSKSKPKSARKPGAQPGNKNALKHGFYAELFTPIEVKRLGGPPLNIEDEQKMLRVKAFQLANLIDFSLEIDEDDLKAMNTLTLIVQGINTLERTKLLARGHGGEIGKTILEALLDLDPYEEL